MLRETLKQIVNFDPESLERLVSLFTVVDLGKGDSFAKKGEYAQQIAFVNQGVLRAF